MLQETLSIIVLRYLLISPSAQRMTQYIADVAHVTSTVFMLAQQYTLPGLARYVLEVGGVCACCAAFCSLHTHRPSPALSYYHVPASRPCMPLHLQAVG